MRCLIVDDEALARQEMRQLLTRHPEMEIVGEADCVEAALELDARYHPEVVFLDVQLRGESGFDFVGRGAAPLAQIVFVTAHDRYAVRGFECNALDYLLKPVRPERLAETVERVHRNGSLRRQTPSDAPLLLKMDDNTARFVSWSTVTRVISEGNYSRVFLEDRSCTLILRPLKEWLALAPEGHFIQVHRTTLIRCGAILEIRNTGEYKREIVLSNGCHVPVGRAYWPEVKALVEGS